LETPQYPRPRRRPLQNLAPREHFAVAASAATKPGRVPFPRAERGAKFVTRAFARVRATTAAARDISSHTLTFAALSVLLLPLPAYAHAGHHHLEPSTFMRWWSWEPFVILPLAITGAMYAIGVTRMKGVRPWQIASFAAGWIALVIALVSPLDALGGILFSAHMAQHEMLMIVAAPLLVFGRPLIAFLWALPQRWRVPVGQFFQREPIKNTWNWISGALVVTILHAIALWVWHIPSWYEATLRNDGIHALQHISFLLTATMFWWSLTHGRYGRLGYGAAVVYVFATAGHSGALGALITFAPHLWYPIYGARTAAWGLNAIEDQQLAGLIMWIPAGVLFTILGIAIFAAWLGEAERRVVLGTSDALRKE
jgi:cytochrome c oxidase assembly factor CtaG